MGIIRNSSSILSVETWTVKVFGWRSLLVFSMGRGVEWTRIDGTMHKDKDEGGDLPLSFTLSIWTEISIPILFVLSIGRETGFEGGPLLPFVRAEKYRPPIPFPWLEQKWASLPFRSPNQAGDGDWWGISLPLCPLGEDGDGMDEYPASITTLSLKAFQRRLQTCVRKTILSRVFWL